MSPSRSSVPQPAVRIITSYETDVTGAADALLATLRPAPRPNVRVANTEPRKDRGSTKVTAEDEESAE